MTRFDALRNITRESEYANIIFLMLRRRKTAKEMADYLSEELTGRILETALKAREREKEQAKNKPRDCDTTKMTRHSALRCITDEKMLSDIVFIMLEEHKTSKEFCNYISGYLTNVQFSIVKAIAKSGNYPLSFDGIQ